MSCTEVKSERTDGAEIVAAKTQACMTAVEQLFGRIVALLRTYDHCAGKLAPREFTQLFQDIKGIVEEEGEYSNVIMERLKKVFEESVTRFLLEETAAQTEIADSAEFLRFFVQVSRNFRILAYSWWRTGILDQAYFEKLSTNVVTETFCLFRQLYWSQNTVWRRLLDIFLEYQIQVLRAYQGQICDEDLRAIAETFEWIGFARLAKTGIMRDTYEVRRADGDEDSLVYYAYQFEAPLFEELARWYSARVQAWRDSLSASEYVEKALNSLEYEEKWADLYYPRSKYKLLHARNAENPQAATGNSTILYAAAEKKTNKEYSVLLPGLLENILIVEYAEYLCRRSDSGVRYLLKMHKHKELALLFKLLYRVRQAGIEPLASEFYGYFQERGFELNQRALVRESEVPSGERATALEYAAGVMALQQECDELVGTYLDNSVRLQLAKKAAFERFLNEYANAPKFLSFHVDDVLRRTAATTGDSSLLDKIVAVSHYLFYKDTFLAHLQTMLQARLLRGLARDTYSELALIQKLGLAHGVYAVRRMNTMLYDIQRSEEAVREYLEAQAAQALPVGVQAFALKLLAQHSWLLRNVSDKVWLPKRLDALRAYYEAHYSAREQKHQHYLRWCLEYQVSELNYIIPKSAKKYTFKVSNFYLNFLLATEEFRNNGSEACTPAKLSELSGDTIEDVLNQLYPLIDSKLLLVNGNVIANASYYNLKAYDTIYLNEDFEHKTRTLDLMPKRRVVKEAKLLIDDVSEYRKIYIRSNLIKVMKYRKQLSQDELFYQSKYLLRLFVPEERHLKQYTEHLLQKGYLQRDKTDTRIFHYLPY